MGDLDDLAAAAANARKKPQPPLHYAQPIPPVPPPPAAYIQVQYVADPRSQFQIGYQREMGRIAARAKLLLLIFGSVFALFLGLCFVAGVAARVAPSTPQNKRQMTPPRPMPAPGDPDTFGAKPRK